MEVLRREALQCLTGCQVIYDGFEEVILFGHREEDGSFSYSDPEQVPAIKDSHDFRSFVVKRYAHTVVSVETNGLKFIAELGESFEGTFRTLEEVPPFEKPPDKMGDLTMKTVERERPHYKNSDLGDTMYLRELATRQEVRWQRGPNNSLFLAEGNVRIVLSSLDRDDPEQDREVPHEISLRVEEMENGQPVGEALRVVSTRDRNDALLRAAFFSLWWRAKSNAT